MATNAGGSAGPGSMWRIVGWGIAVALLLMPLIATQFTTEVNWTVGDFAFAATMFAAVGGTLELTVRKTRSRAYRAGVVVALAAAFLLIWINGAVGIIGDEGNPGNLLYLAVVLIATAGAIVTRARSGALAGVMAVAAIATLLVPPLALAGIADPDEPVLHPEVPVATAIFAGMWLVSAWLFRRAAREPR